MVAFHDFWPGRPNLTTEPPAGWTFFYYDHHLISLSHPPLFVFSIMSSSPEILGSIDTSLGAVFIGFALACCVYGILVSQTFSYFRNYPGDRTVFKWTVRIRAPLEYLRNEAEWKVVRWSWSCEEFLRVGGRLSCSAWSWLGFWRQQIKRSLVISCTITASPIMRNRWCSSEQRWLGSYNSPLPVGTP